MSKYLPDNPDLGEFIVVDEKPHSNGAKMVEGFFEGAPGEPLCGVCECRLDPHINDDGERVLDLEGCPTPIACEELLSDPDIVGQIWDAILVDELKKQKSEGGA
jgi:hypothetical protein